MGSTEKRENSTQQAGGENDTGRFGDSDLSTGAVVAGAIAGLAAVVLGVAGFFSGSTSSGEQGKTMKAPGQEKRIIRNDFERDPKSYFKDLRKK